MRTICTTCNGTGIDNRPYIERCFSCKKLIYPRNGHVCSGSK